MSAGFTPGPWAADRTCVRNAEGEHRFTCGLTRTAYASRDEMLANANLIAAAPELYNCLGALLNELACVNEQLDLMPDDYAEALTAAQRAIAKARGDQ